MKKILTLAALALILQAAPVLAATTNVKVNGLVCDFCAQSIIKTFKKHDGVNDVIVDLDGGLVSLDLADGTDMNDETITKLITDAGYTVTGIERTK